MFSKDNLKRLAEQAQKAGSRLATNAQGSNTWFAGQGAGTSRREQAYWLLHYLC